MAIDDSFIGRLRASILGATITQRFGCTGYVGENSGAWAGQPGCQHFHSGVDLVLAGGTRANVYAPASGIVTQVDTNPAVGYGNSVRIRDPHGFTWIVGHLLNTPRVNVGDHVTAGTILGNQGSTGSSSGVHLHLEVRNAQNVPVNPANNARGPVVGSGIMGGVGVGDIFYGLAHTFGFGAGATQGSIQVPPDPVTGGVPASGVTGGPGPSGDPGTTSDPCGPFPMPATVASVGGWLACKAAQAATGGTTGTTGTTGTPNDAGVITNEQGVATGYLVSTPLGPITIPNPLAAFETNVKTEVVPVVIVGVASLVLLFAGFRKLTQEAPVRVVTEPIGAAKGKVEGAGRTVGTAAATVAGKPGAAAFIGARGAGAKAQSAANQVAARRQARAKAAKATATKTAAP